LRGARTAREAIGDKPPDSTLAGSLTARSGMSPKEMWERKKVALIKELQATAEALDDSDVDAILSPVTAVGEEAEAEFNKKKALVDRMRERVQKQLRREAQREIDRVTATAAAASTREERARRLEAQRKEQAEAMKVQADKRAAQHAKVQERVKAGLVQLKQKRDEINAKLSEADERVNKLLEERANGTGDQEFREKTRKRFARIAEWRLTHEQDELKEKAEKFEKGVQHHQGVTERLQKAREEERIRLEEQREKFSGKLDKVVEKHALEELDKRDKFFKHSEQMTEARGRAAESTKEKIESLQAARAKQLTKCTTNKQSIMQKKRTYINELRAKLAEMPVKAEELRERHLEESLSTKLLTRGTITQIVEQNKARISRGDETSRKQMLAKIERAKAKAETSAETKRQIEALRTQIIKESMHDKAHVEELRRLDPGATEASSRRVNDILQRLDLPTLKTKALKEGEEGQQQ